jgi:sulfhydrogenase subunit delta
MKPKVAFFDLTSCEGCQLTVVDSLQTQLDLLDVITIVQFREALSDSGDDYDIAFVEGSITSESDETRLKAIREKAATLVALGACAHIGGVNAIKNLSSLDDVRWYVYGDEADWFETAATRPLDAVVKVDAFVPGCPIDRNEFIGVIKALLRGQKPRIPDYAVCMDCKLKEIVCVFDKGGFCMGPITRSGCNVICPTYGVGCEGCRGMISKPNLKSMRSVLAEHGLAEDAITTRLTMFDAYEMSKA